MALSRVILFFFIAFSSKILAATWEESLSNSVQYYSDEVIPLLIASTGDEQKHRIKSIEIIVKKNPADVRALFVTSEDERRFIFVTTGFLDALFRYVDVFLMQEEFGRSDLTKKYFKYFFDTVYSGDSNAPKLPVIYFLPKEKRDNWVENERLEAAKGVMYLSALIVILTHEVAHHALDNLYGPLTPFPEKKSSELASDEWAYDILDKVGEGPAVGAIIGAGLILEYERYENLNDNVSLRHHPAPVSRAENGWKRTCEGELKEKLKKPCNILEKIIENMD